MRRASVGELVDESIYTPSDLLKKERNTNAGSTLPVHMTRTSLISFEYCSLETPARSAAPYCQQQYAKPMILGLNLSPALICFYSLTFRLVAPNWIRGFKIESGIEQTFQDAHPRFVLAVMESERQNTARFNTRPASRQQSVRMR
jgi:hypothetical protein